MQSLKMPSLKLIQQTIKDIIEAGSKSAILADSKSKLFCKQYVDLQKQDKTEQLRNDLLKSLCQNYGIKKQALYKTITSLNSASNNYEEFEKNFRKVNYEKLMSSLKPEYYGLFQNLGRVKDGVHVVVKIRQDLLNLLETKKKTATQFEYQEDLKIMDSILKSFLVLWFSTGLLEIQRVDWNSPAEIVEKVAHYESVHQIRTLNDLKNRLSSSRRCFIYTHSTMPNEPLVILHIALTNSISSNIRSFIHSTQKPNENKDAEPNYTNAIFYSINSCQKGLQQVDLGNALIKSCVQLLIKEMPSLKYFHTLSPIPNFKEWLDLRLNMAISKSKSDSASTINKQPDEYFNLRRFLKHSELEFLGNYFNLNSQDDFPAILSRLKIYINSAKFRGDVQAVDAHGNKLACYDNELLNTTLINFLKRTCAFYLYHEKKNGFAFNSVCNFHIKNGAQIYRLNFGGDTTEKGWKTSYSLMVNYGYYLEDLDSNCINYLTNKTIKVSDLFNEVVKEIN